MANKTEHGDKKNANESVKTRWLPRVSIVRITLCFQVTDLCLLQLQFQLQLFGPLIDHQLHMFMINHLYLELMLVLSITIVDSELLCNNPCLNLHLLDCCVHL